MWLIVPYAFAVIAFCVIEAAAVRSSGQSAGLRKSVIVGGVGFALAASGHLLYVAIVSPADLKVWLSAVYLGIFSGHGVTGAKLSALSDYARHRHSALYYPLILYRDHFFLLPLCVFGLDELLRVPQVRSSRLLAMIGGASVAVVALSVPVYKDPRYVLAMAPFLYAFAGLCLAALGRSPDMLRPETRSVVRLGMGIALACSVVVLVVYLSGGPVKVSGLYVTAHVAGTLLCVLVGEVWIRTRFVTQQLAALAGIGLVAFAALHPRMLPAPPYAALAAALEPHLSDAPPAYPSFVAHDSEVLQGYLQRTGTTFDELAAAPQPAPGEALRAFVFTPTDRSRAAQAMQAWLKQHARDISVALGTGPDTPPHYQIYVR
jgi:hypothetical protein